MHEGDERRHAGGDATHEGDDEGEVREGPMHRFGGKDGEHAGHEVEAGVDHRRSVDEGGDGRRTLHRVREPHVQWELGGLADRTDEHEAQCELEGAALACVRDGLQVTAVEDDRIREGVLAGGVGLEKVPEHGQPDDEEHVTNTGREEGFLGRVSGRGALVVEADEQVRTQAHQFPENEQPQERVREDHAEHPRAEEHELRIEAVVAVVVDRIRVHVADAEDVDQQAKETGHKEEHDRGVVHVKAEVEAHGLDAAGRGVMPTEIDPVQHRGGVGNGGLSDEFRDEHQGTHEACRHDGKRKQATFLHRPLPPVLSVEQASEEKDDREGQHWKQNDEQGVVGHDEARCVGISGHGLTSVFQQLDLIERNRLVLIVH